MTREEIALFLDLDESFTSGQLEECFSRKLAEIRQEMAQAGSKAARAIARTRLDRFEKKAGEIESFAQSVRALEEASAQLAKAEEYLKNGRARLASVPLGRLREIKRELLPAQLQDRIDEIGVILEEEAQKAELAVREAEMVAREAAEKVRREEAAERARIEAEARERLAEEEARLAVQRAAEKAALEAAEAERRAVEEAARKEAEALAAEEAAEKTRAEAEERASIEKAERLAREKEALPPAAEKKQAVASGTDVVSAHLHEAKPKTTSCSSLTIEYHRGNLGKRRLHILTNLSATFGRSVNSDVVVRVMASMGDAEQINRLIGRCHFMVENTGRFVNIIDGSRVENGTIKASTNGVFIDGRRLVYPRSIEGRGETLHIASQQLASHVAHWTLKLVGEETASVPDAVRHLRPEGKWPQVSGLFMARQDEMPEDVLFVWEAVPLSIADARLAPYWLVRSGEGLLIWDGTTMRDFPSSGLFPVLSAGRLAHIGG